MLHVYETRAYKYTTPRFKALYYYITDILHHIHTRAQSLPSSQPDEDADDSDNDAEDSDDEVLMPTVRAPNFAKIAARRKQRDVAKEEREGKKQRK